LLSRSPADAHLIGQPALEGDRLLQMKAFEVAITGVFFKPAQRRGGSVDGGLAQAASLLQVDEIGALDALILRTVHPHGLPAHG
jgi:hypothetical protein